MKNNINDIDQRERFQNEIDVNFSVIAPAGSGKTSLIVSRVVNLAIKAPERLQRVIVVTYTNQAADEMLYRVRYKLLEKKAIKTVEYINKAFFGTIHSLCYYIIRKYSPYLGLPSEPSVIQMSTLSYTELKNEFLRTVNLDSILPQDLVSICSRFIDPSEIINNALNISIRDIEFQPIPPSPPQLDLTAVLNYPAKSKSTKIESFKKEIYRWYREYMNINKNYISIPNNPSTTNKEFCDIWEESIKPLYEWLIKAINCISYSVANEFLKFRIKKGFITFDDQIFLARLLLQDENISPLIIHKPFYVLLDESQDTDSFQFDVLLRLAGGSGIKDKNDFIPPLQGHFCMVGDFQQSIFTERASLDTYIQLHNMLIESKGAEEIKLNTTFRCSKTIVDFMNRIGPKILDGENGQAEYIKIQTYPESPLGTVKKIVIPSKTDVQGDNQLTIYEANIIADIISHYGYEGLGTNKWSEIAILLPRRRWIQPFEMALRERGIPVKTVIPNQKVILNPCLTWPIAICMVIAQPDNSMELAGILHEIFAIPDDEIVSFIKNSSNQFSLRVPHAPSTKMEDFLALLYNLKQNLIEAPFTEIINTIFLKVPLVNILKSIGFDSETIKASYNMLLCKAIDAQNRGLTLEQFVKELSDYIYSSGDSYIPELDAVQITTCHAAKGLEWDCVIVPLITRRIAVERSYPSVLKTANTKILLYSPHMLLNYEKTLIKIFEHHQNQRLLYVTFTRARKSLFIVDDTHLEFKSKEGNENFAGIILSADNEVLQKMPSISHESSSENIIKLHKTAITPQQKSTNIHTDSILAELKLHLPEFPIKISPSELVIKEFYTYEEEITAAIDIPETAVDYGIWWHKMMEDMPWKDRKKWDIYFKKHIPLCPYPERGENEWKNFLASELSEFLHKNSEYIFTEVPYLYQINRNLCSDGIIDLVVFSDNMSTILIIDWKTDELEDEQLASRIKEYTPQIRAYKDAIKFFVPETTYIKAMIYSTCSGRTFEI